MAVESAAAACLHDPSTSTSDLRPPTTDNAPPLFKLVAPAHGLAARCITNSGAWLFNENDGRQGRMIIEM